MDKFRLYKFVLKPSHTKETDWTKIIVAEKTVLSKAQETFEELLNGVFKEASRVNETTTKS